MAGLHPALKILHVMRSPVGGLFRHVVDLVRGQAARGHQVGIVADSTTGGTRANGIFNDLERELSLGLVRCPMSRHAGLRDLTAARVVARRVRDVAADVIHGHGAKGGAYARLTDGRGAVRVYTPHGGSLHFSWSSLTGMAYLALERCMLRRTELFVFESAFARGAFNAKIGEAGLTRVVHNGLASAEFAPVEPADQVADIVFVGELRRLKGVDVLIDAIGILTNVGRPVSALIVGAGPDAAAFDAQAEALGLTAVRFVDAMPSRRAFARGRLVVVPSRAESLPYIVLEAAAAAVPLVTTAVGGIPEIFGPLAARLVAPGDAAMLAQSIAAGLDDPAAAHAAARALQARVREHFSVDAMTEQVLAGYQAALAGRPASDGGSILPPH
jgi:glycosyltransferase involved in cell wall biosynthesis